MVVVMAVMVGLFAVGVVVTVVQVLVLFVPSVLVGLE